MSTLLFDAVSVEYRTGRSTHRAVDTVRLEVPHGTTTGLVGESGSGKSTLGLTAVGLVRPSAGQVCLDGERLVERGRRRRVQLVFQDPYAALDPRMTVGESVAEALIASGRRYTGSAARHRVAELLELVALDPALATRRPGQLSGGMRQRIALARALAGEPEVLVADEITSALDVSIQASILNLLVRLQRELALTVLFVSHNLAVTRYVSDRIAVMRAGTLVAQGGTDEIVRHCEHPYVRELLAAVPPTPARHPDPDHAEEETR